MEKWACKLLFEVHEYADSINIENVRDMQSHEFCIMITDAEDVKKDIKLRNKLTPFLGNGTNFSRWIILWKNFSLPILNYEVFLK